MNPAKSTNNAFFAWCRSNRVVLSSSALGLTAAFLIYKNYNSPKIPKDEHQALHQSSPPSRAGLFSWLAALSNYSQAASAMSSSVALVTSDLQAFLTSSDAEVPPSLHQLLKLLMSNDVQGLIQTSASSIANGVAQGAVAVMSSSTDDEAAGSACKPSSVETIIEAILSERGHSLLGLAVGVASKNATASLCDLLERVLQPRRDFPSGEVQAEEVLPPSSFSPAGLFHLLASDDGDKVISMLITRSIQTAVRTYVEATAGYSMYEDMLGSVSKKENRDVVTEIITKTTAVFCKEVASAYQRACPSPSSSRANSHGGRTGGGVGVTSGTTARGMPVLSSMTPSSSRSSMDGGTLRDTGDMIGGGMILIPRTSSSGALPPLAPQQHSNQKTSDTFSPHLSYPKLNAPRQSIHNPPDSGFHSLVQSHHMIAPSVSPVIPTSSWILKQVVDLAKEKDVRTLAVDVVGSATRGVMETLIHSLGGGGSMMVSQGMRQRKQEISATGAKEEEEEEEFVDCTRMGASPFAISLMTAAVQRLSLLVTILFLIVLYLATSDRVSIA